jgi:SAM-dependent methyltransferase
MDYSLGCRLTVAEWASLNRTEIFQDPQLMEHVSPFPPSSLMQNVSGLVNERDFASHGADLFVALSDASPKRLADFQTVLDFGCGCGRLARMFKGHPHRVCGCDIDLRHVDWVRNNLDHIEVVSTSVHPPLPYADNEFEAIISISVFTHLNETSQIEFLRELHRISQRGGYLFLTVHGQRALERAVNEKPIREMIDVEELPFQKACKAFSRNEHAFILQHGHLTTSTKKIFSLRRLFRSTVINEPFEYGITFIPEAYIRKHWGRWFEIVDYRHGAIHSFQDIVVLMPKK